MASIRELHHQLVTKQRSAVEIATEAIDRVEKLEPKLRSFLRTTPTQALEQARSTQVIASQRHGDAPDPCSVPRTQSSAFENDSSRSEERRVGKEC